jgi:ABC-type glycerol-3-phosphate transport system substrate-binding protein
MVGKMTTRKIGVLAVAALLAACASTNGPTADQSAGVRNATLIVPEGSAPSANVVKAADVNEAKGSTVPDIPGVSKLMRIYWFLGGR